MKIPGICLSLLIVCATASAAEAGCVRSKDSFHLGILRLIEVSRTRDSVDCRPREKSHREPKERPASGGDRPTRSSERTVREPGTHRN